MSTSPLPPTTPPGPPPIMTLAQAEKLKGWIALDGWSNIVGHAPTEADLRALFGHIETVVYFALHLFEEPLPEERVGTRILHGIVECRRAKAFPEDPRAAAARLPAQLRKLLLAVDEIAATNPKAGAPMWALAKWTGTTELDACEGARRLMDRDIVNFHPGANAVAWPTPLGRHVARLTRASRIV